MRVDELFICMGVKHSFTGNGAAGWRRNLTLIPASGGTTGSGNRITPPFWLGSLGELGVAAGVATPAILFLAGELAVVAAILSIFVDKALASGVGAFAYLRKRRHVLLRYQ